MDMPSPEKFNGTIEPLKAEDIIKLIPILQTWIVDRNTQQPLPEEVEAIADEMLRSTEFLTANRYLVAKSEDGEVLGVMGLRVPEEKMMEYTSTPNPGELINAYVSKDHRHGKGVGTTLLNSIYELARLCGYTEIVLNSGPRYRFTGWGFYFKVIGQPVAMAKGYYGEGGDAPIWRKVLV